MLESGHERDAPGGRFEGVQGCPDGGIADGMDLRGDPAGGGSLRQLAEPLGFGVPDAASAVGGSGRSGSGSMSARSAAVRDPSEPSAKHFCQPTRARPFGSAPRIAPLRNPPASAVSRASSENDAMTRSGSRPVSDRCA